MKKKQLRGQSHRNTIHFKNNHQSTNTIKKPFWFKTEKNILTISSDIDNSP